MFGGKFTQQAFANSFRNLKQNAISTYHHGKRWFNQFNNAYTTAKKVYSLAAPAIENLGGSQLNKNVIKAMGGYEQMRNKVMDTRDTVFNNVNQVAGQLKKNNINIGL